MDEDNSFYFDIKSEAGVLNSKASRNQVTCVERPRTLVVVVYW